MIVGAIIEINHCSIIEIFSKMFNSAQNNNGFHHGFAQIKNRYKTVRAPALGSCPYSLRLNELFGAYRP